MTKPILYGIYLSPPVRAVLLVAKAINLELEFRNVDLFKDEHKTPEFLAINPQQTVPTLDDDGFIIWESHAIITYLISKYGKDDSLYPKDLRKRALVDQRMHFETGILFVRMRAIIARIIFYNEPEIAAEKLKDVDEAYGYMERFLEKGNYMCGNTVTAADLSLVSTFSSGQGIVPVNPAKYPKLAAWFKRMKSFPHYEEINGKYAQELIDLINSKIAEFSK